MSDRRTVVVTAYGHDKIVDKIAVSTFEENDNYRFPSDAMHKLLKKYFQIS